MSKAFLIASAAALSLAGCASLPGQFNPDEVDQSTGIEIINSKVLKQDWQTQADPSFDVGIEWTDLSDPVLMALIGRGLKNSLTLESTLLSLRSAQISLEQAEAEKNPILSLGSGRAGVSQSRRGSPVDSYALGASASYRVDLWGLVDSNVKRSELALADRVTALRAARIDTARFIAQSYFDIRVQDEFIRLQEEQISIQNEQLRLSKVRLEAGTITRLGVDQLNVSISTLESSLEGFKTTRANQVRSLAILLGEPPQNFSLTPAPFVFWDVPRLKPSAPAEVITRRPDIERAERSVMVSGIALDSARKAWLPSLNLSANSGTGGLSITDLLSTDALTASISAGLSVLLYNNGNRKRSLEQSEISREQSLIAYERTLLGALDGIERLLAQQDENLRQVGLLELRQEAQDRVTKITQVRYDTGAASAFDLITEQSTALSVRRTRVSTWLTGMRTSINMLSELGVEPSL
ncbi:MAG: TolC family protein [Alphaproteobacteria bacterium]